MSEPNHLYHQALSANRKLLAENARLKAEVEAYKHASDEVAAAFLALPAPHNQVCRVVDGIESLKSEVERLNAERDNYRYSLDGLGEEYEELQAENERLRKAGDWMCGLLKFDFVTKEWNAAKEGKPSV